MTSSRAFGAGMGTASRWLAIVGIGEDGLTGLGEEARRAIADAEIVFGGARHLELAAEEIAGERRQWPSPFDKAVDEIEALRGKNVCVLASGDPFHFGVGATLARRIPAEEMRVFSAPSSFALAAARLGWPLQAVETVSLHGRPIALIRPLLHPGARILALTSDGAAPAAIAELITKEGFGPSRFHVLEALGGPRERKLSFTASELSADGFDDLNLVAIEVAADEDARILPLGTGLGDALFENDGQITKSEVRAVTLSALAPKRGERLWDIGAGSGSISIEWLRQHPSLSAIAVESDAGRAARIAYNAERMGVPHLNVEVGRAPAALAGLAAPDVVFIGGGATAPGLMEAAMAALGAGGRLVANGVTLETQALLIDCHGRHGGELIEIAIARAAPVGSMRALRPAMPVLQWRWRKP